MRGPTQLIGHHGDLLYEQNICTSCYELPVFFNLIFVYYVHSNMSRPAPIKQRPKYLALAHKGMPQGGIALLDAPIEQPIQ